MRIYFGVAGILASAGVIVIVSCTGLLTPSRYIRDAYELVQCALRSILGPLFIGYVVALVPSVVLANRLGAYRMLCVATVSWAAIALVAGALRLTAFDNSLLVHLLLGVSQALALPSFTRTAAHWIKRATRLTATPLVRAASLMGGALIPVAIQGLVQSRQWGESLFATGAVTLVAALSSSRTLASSEAQHQEELPNELRSASSTSPEGFSEHTWRVSVRGVLLSRNAYALCGSQFCFGIAKFAFFTWAFFYFMAHRDITGNVGAQFQTAAYLAMVIGTAVGGWVWDKAAGGHSVPFVALTVAGICGMVAPRITNTTGAALLFTLAVGFLYAAAPCFQSVGVDISRHSTGLFRAVHSGASRLGGTVGKSSAPALVTFLQSCSVARPWEIVLQLAGGIGLVSGMIWLLINASRPTRLAPLN